MNQTRVDVRAGYDAAAREYAEKFAGELAYKPLDRELLAKFAAEVKGKGPVSDLGCGPGQTTALLHLGGAEVTGIDLSPRLVEEGRRLFPEVKFEVGDMLALPREDGTQAGIVAFYAIVHFSKEELRRAIREMHRALAPDGKALLSFHIGDETVRVEGFLGKPVTLEFRFFEPSFVRAELEAAGFVGVEVVERAPYPEEHPTRRAYVSARKRENRLNRST